MDQALVQKLIAEECDAIKDLLIRKNQDYGNSFAEPLQVFSQSDPVEQLWVRIDDKLKRIQNRDKKNDPGEDSTLDLIGYLILSRVLFRLNREAFLTVPGSHLWEKLHGGMTPEDWWEKEKGRTL